MKKIVSVLLSFGVLSAIVFCFCSCDGNPASDNGAASSKLSNSNTELLAYENIGGVAEITGIGAYPSTDLIIPEEIGGMPVVSIGKEAFEDSRITSVVIADTVTEIQGSAFYNCEYLTSVTIGKGVTRIHGFAFNNCNSLEAVYITDLSAWCGISLDSLSFDSNFNYYINGELVSDIVIPDSVTSICDYVFQNCDSLTTVTLGINVTDIGDYAFDDCDSLETINIPGNINLDIPYSFRYCESPISFNVLGNDPYYYSENGILFSKDKTQLLCYNKGKSGSYSIPDSVTSIGFYAFSYCNNLTSITIPESVTEIQRGAFYCCDGLTSITIPKSVTEIQQEAFAHCGELTSITISNDITIIGYDAFAGCNKLTSVNIPENIRYDFVDSFRNESGRLCLPDGLEDDFPELRSY